jgi:uncharacterized protein YybS (DUF2232 family)
MAELLLRRQSIEKSAVFSMISMLVVAILLGFAYGRVRHVNPGSLIVQEMNQGMEQVAKSLQQNGHQSMMEAGDLEEWKKGIWVEMPSAVAILALVMVWINLVILLRLNPKGVRETLGLDRAFFRNWKAPEFLVWPTIVCGFFLLVEVKYVSWVALNCFKVLMTVYAIQCLSVLSYFFDAWKIRRFFRSTGLMLVTFVMTPLLLSLGFFDLWFDFRSKFRQS